MDSRVDTLIQQAKAGALVDWPALAAASEPAILMEACRVLDSEIQTLARLSAYLYERGGCGYDQGHEQAVRQQNTLVAKVRRALGFTYPRQDVTFAARVTR